MGIAVCIASKDDFNWLQGEGKIRQWSKPGHDWQTSFCEVCSSPVPGENDENNMYIPASLLTSDDSTLRITHHLYIGSKASWEEIAGGAKQHVAGYSG
uniref:GFA family protein n=1 Tax=Gilvimarinus agarilyticus TaxID=679259 RepID=UPI0018DCD358